MQSIIRYPHAVPPKVFWEKVFFNEEYQKRLHFDVLGASDFEILEQKGTVETGIQRRIRFTLAMDVPKVLEKIIGDGLSNVEDGSFDPAKSTFTYHVTPSKMADKLKIGGEMRAEDKGDGTMERIIVLDTKAKIIGLGKIIEGFIDKSVRDTHKKVRAFTDQWIKEQGLS